VTESTWAAVTGRVVAGSNMVAAGMSGPKIAFGSAHRGEHVAEVRKTASPLEVGRNGRVTKRALADSPAVIISKNEGLVLNNRPAG